MHPIGLLMSTLYRKVFQDEMKPEFDMPKITSIVNVYPAKKNKKQKTKQNKINFASKLEFVASSRSF